MLFIEALKALAWRALAWAWLRIRVLAWALLASYRLARHKPATQNALHLLQEAETCIRAARSSDPALHEALGNQDLSVDDLLAEAQEKLVMAREFMAFVRPDLYVERD
ncbi:MAG: hypothetical protein AB1830_13105 [Pseudomonadota bacterium]